MRRYLEHIAIDRYGSLAGKEVGPFSPGLNVVYGPNEAGKSSIASFIGGVMFGWEEARGVRNTYRPVEGERAGSLIFAQAEDEAESQSDAREVRRWQLRRERNEDGAQGTVELLADVDNATYRSMFLLTSDRLRSLHNTSDVTARLLAAGSATGTSPSAAFVEIEQQIAALTDPNGQDSIPALSAERDRLRVQIDQTAEAVALVKQEARERDQLAEGRLRAAAQASELNARVEELHALKARLEAIDAQQQRHRSDADAANAEVAQVQSSAESEETCSRALLQMDAAAERALRDTLEELGEEQAQAARAVDVARENAAASQAAYEALLELDESDGSRARRRSNRIAQAIVSVLPSLAFVVAGLLMFVYGRQTSSLSFTAFGAGLLVMAFLLAIGAFAVLSRPDKGAEALENRRKDAQWVMLQDQKKLDSSMQAKSDVDARVRECLEQAGLAEAQGSIRQARGLLDDVRELRSRMNLAQQRVSALTLRANSAQEALEVLAHERRQLEEEHELPEGAAASYVDHLIREVGEQRDTMGAALADLNQRYGELDQRLGLAAEDRSYDQVKLQFQQVSCRLREARARLVTLLLAKRMLDKSIAAWESRNQPQVFEEASRLFDLMTGGAWKNMHMTSEGRMVAVSAEGEAREVRHLSLGTCQQLYLALRVALLEHADNVGRSIPVIVDDILVNFDAQRRENAALVLAELARKRQVIVFTCHRETVLALRKADSSLAYVELQA